MSVTALEPLACRIPSTAHACFGFIEITMASSIAVCRVHMSLLNKLHKIETLLCRGVKTQHTAAAAQMKTVNKVKHG